MKNIVIVGVGGQGTLLASKILGYIGLENGYDVRVSEVHGMSQRGGSVVTYVRLSDNEKIYYAIVEQGQADVVLAFENLEAVRALPYLKEDGIMIVNTQELLPMPVIIGAAEYPENLLEKMRQAGLEPKCGGAHEGFSHWVEQAVTRDIVVGVRPEKSSKEA